MRRVLFPDFPMRSMGARPFEKNAKGGEGKPLLPKGLKRREKNSGFFVQNAKNTRYGIFLLTTTQDMVYNRGTQLPRTGKKIGKDQGF